MDTERIRLFAVDYRYADGAATFEIFDTLPKAESFIRSFDNPQVCIPVRLWQGDFDTDMVYQESNGEWNYEEFAGMVANEQTIRVMNEKLPEHYVLN